MSKTRETVKPRGSAPAKVSPSHEDYLEAIYQLGGRGGCVRSVDLALCMEVSKASVNKAVNNLKGAGLVEQPRYGDITLTQRGLDYAQGVQSRHEVLTEFLVSVLGIDSKKATAEACLMEHAISDETLDRWISFMRMWNDEQVPAQKT